MTFFPGLNFCPVVFAHVKPKNLAAGCRAKVRSFQQRAADTCAALSTANATASQYAALHTEIAAVKDSLALSGSIINKCQDP